MARQEPPKEQRHIGTLPESLDREVRVTALVAAGQLGDAKVIDDVLPLMDHTELAMKEAATFTLGRTGDKRAVPALVKALAYPRPSVQVLACRGLSQVDDPRAQTAVVAVVKDASRTDSVRAACAYAIGARRNAAGTTALLGALADNRGDTQRLAAWALGQLGETKALCPLVRAYFSREGSGADELVWAIGRTSGGGLAPSSLADLGEYPMRSGKFDETTAVHALPGPLPRGPAAGKLVVDHVVDISAGLNDALGEHRDVVVSVLADLDAAPDRLALGALTPGAGDPKVTAALAQIAAAIEPKISLQLSAEDPKVRALAVSVMAKMDGGKQQGADAAIEKALADPADQVRAAAMTAIPVVAKRRGSPPQPLVNALIKVAAAPGWADRRIAVLALGKIGTPGAVAVLVGAAKDPSSFVREAVALALGETGAPAGRPALEALAKDDVPQVREAATRALGQPKP